MAEQGKLQILALPVALYAKTTTKLTAALISELVINFVDNEAIRSQRANENPDVRTKRLTLQQVQVWRGDHDQSRTEQELTEIWTEDLEKQKRI